MSLAFEGVRVLDFSQVISGPVVSHLLSQLGAEVIKIETAAGDQLRGLFRGGNEPEDAPSECFANLNRGKRSVLLDLKTPEGRDAALKIAETCDVVLENFRPGAIARLGLDYETIKAVNPKVIYCSISGFGQEGPLSDRHAYDGVIQAVSGMMSLNGHKATGPTRTNYMPVDVSTGLMASFALASALYRRAMTGEGQRLDVSMLDTATMLLGQSYSRYIAGGGIWDLIGNRSPTGWPTADCFAAQDGYLLISTVTREQASGMLETLGLSIDILDEFLACEPESPESEVVRKKIHDAFQADTCAGWIAKLSKVKVPVQKVSKISETIELEQYQHRSILQPATPEHRSGGAYVFGGAFVANQDGPQTEGPAPALGGETEAVLREAGLDEAAIAALAPKKG